MDLFGIGSALGGLFGASGNAIASRNNLQAQRETNEANIRMNTENNNLQRELALQKYEKDLEQWNRENAYNSPAATMARYREAGINPYLAVGQDQGAAASPQMELAQTSPAHIEAPREEGNFVTGIGAAFASGISEYMDQKYKEQQLNLMKNQEDLQQQQLLKMAAETAREWSENTRLSINNSFDKDRQEWFRKSRQWEEQKYELDLSIARHQNDLLQNSVNRIDVTNRLQDLDVDLKSAEIGLKKDMHQLNFKQLKWFDREMESKIALRWSAFNLNNAQGQLAAARTLAQEFNNSYYAAHHAWPATDKQSVEGFWYGVIREVYNRTPHVTANPKTWWNEIKKYFQNRNIRGTEVAKNQHESIDNFVESLGY